jgi:hypothetical protein
LDSNQREAGDFGIRQWSKAAGHRGKNREIASTFKGNPGLNQSEFNECPDSSKFQHIVMTYNRRVCVFVSPAFRDMMVRRDELITHAWTELCRGVTDEVAGEHRRKFQRARN